MPARTSVSHTTHVSKLQSQCNSPTREPWCSYQMQGGIHNQQSPTCGLLLVYSWWYPTWDDFEIFRISAKWLTIVDGLRGPAACRHVRNLWYPRHCPGRLERGQSWWESLCYLAGTLVELIAFPKHEQVAVSGKCSTHTEIDWID